MNSKNRNFLIGNIILCLKGFGFILIIPIQIIFWSIIALTYALLIYIGVFLSPLTILTYFILLSFYEFDFTIPIRNFLDKQSDRIENIPLVINASFNQKLGQKYLDHLNYTKSTYLIFFNEIDAFFFPKNHNSSEPSFTIEPNVKNNNPLPLPPNTVDKIKLKKEPIISQKKLILPKSKIQTRIQPSIRKVNHEELNNKKHEIGRIGELLVMEFEKKRLSRELSEGKNINDILFHNSLIEGDGHGYDITSRDNNRVIKIEVKSTTGDFKNNIFFSTNEIETMKKWGDNYYLYRVFNLDISNKTGDIAILKGKDLIEEVFNFLEVSYSAKFKSFRKKGDKFQLKGKFSN